MAGGKGERFWPWSREKRPKQLLPLFGKKTMIEMTVERLAPLVPRQRVWIVTNAAQARAMKRLMPSFPNKNFIVEPVGRDSGGAVMLGCATVAARDPDAVMALLPSDSLIKDVSGYRRVLGACFKAAAKEKLLLTIGTRPTHPSTAYGYIERGARMSGAARMFHVRRFVEKPKLQKAMRLVKSGRFYWNAGMFVWSAGAIREALEKYSPAHAAGWAALGQNRRAYLASGFLKLPKISIDYAVMEKARNIGVAEAMFDWDDVGSWSAMAAHMPLDRNANASRGNVLLHDAKGCLVFGGKQMVAALGVRDLVIVQTDDATFICHRDAAQRVKELVKQLPPSLK